MKIIRIISGGQTGVDRAALDAAMQFGIPGGGWCPAGRLAEDGAIPDRYPLAELDTPEYAARTRRNVVESDGTLVLNKGDLADGTALTVELARMYSKPVLVIQLDKQPDPEQVLSWIREHRVGIVNIAGPRESKRPGIHQLALQFLRKLLSNAF